jgi:hypothetical protein
MPETEKPVPDREAEFTVTAAVPVEVRVKSCVEGTFTELLPNDKLAALRLSVGTTAFSCRVKLWETPPAAAVSVAAWAVDTAEAAAEKPAVAAPAGTVTEAGTVTDALLLARATVNPPVPACALSVTAQATVPVPVIAVFVQERPASVGVALTSA